MAKCACGYGGCDNQLWFNYSDAEHPHFVAEKRGVSVLVYLSDEDLAKLAAKINAYLKEQSNEGDGSGEGHSGHEQLGNPQC